MAEASGSNTSAEAAKPVIGILSIGDMGYGIAKLLLSHDYTVTTCTAGRSPATINRIKSASIKGYDTDTDFVGNSDIIFSIVPPRDAIATARRVARAAQDEAAIEARSARTAAGDSLLYVDFNAVSPVTSRKIAEIFVQARTRPRARVDSKDSRQRSISEAPPDAGAGADAPPTGGVGQRRMSLRQRLTSFAAAQSASQASNSAVSDVPLLPRPPPIPISYLDGGIIGLPPRLPAASTTTTTTTTESSGGGSSSSSAAASSSASASWILPSLVVSGPGAITDALLPAPLRSILNVTIVSPKIGDASTLKCSFGSLTKGLTAIAVLSFTTAHSQNPSLLPHLIRHLEAFQPGTYKFLASSVPRMPPKAYRWVDEMREIGATFSAPVEDPAGGGGGGGGGGGFSPATGKQLFDAVAEIYRFISEDTDLPNRAAATGKKPPPPAKSGDNSSSAGTKRPLSSVQDVAEGVRDGIAAKLRRKEGKEQEKLELTWRGSWH